MVGELLGEATFDLQRHSEFSGENFLLGRVILRPK